MAQSPNDARALGGLFAGTQRQPASPSMNHASMCPSFEASALQPASLVTTNRPEKTQDDEGWSSGSDSGAIPLWPARHSGDGEMTSRRDTTTAAPTAGASTVLKSTSSKWPTVNTASASPAHSVAGRAAPTPGKDLPPMGPGRAPRAQQQQASKPSSDADQGWSSDSDGGDATTNAELRTADMDSRRSTTQGGSLNFCSVSTKSDPSGPPTPSMEGAATRRPRPAGVLPVSSPSRVRGEALDDTVDGAAAPAGQSGWSSDDEDEKTATRVRVVETARPAAPEAAAAGWSCSDSDQVSEQSAAVACAPLLGNVRQEPATRQYVANRPPLASHTAGTHVHVPKVRSSVTQPLRSFSQATDTTDDAGWSDDDEDDAPEATLDEPSITVSAVNRGLGGLFRRDRQDDAAATPRQHSISVHRDDSVAGPQASMREARWNSFGQTMMSLQPLTGSASTAGHSRETFAEGLTLGVVGREIDPMALENPHVDDLAYEKFCYAFAAIRLTAVLARALRFTGTASAADARNRIESAHVAARELPRHAVMASATSAGTWARLVTVVEKALERVPLRNLDPHRAHPELCDIHVQAQAMSDRSAPRTADIAGGWSDDEEDSASPAGSPSGENNAPYTARDWLINELRAFSDRRRAALGEWAALRWMTSSRGAAHPDTGGRTSGISADSEDMWEHVKSHIGMDEVVPGVFCGSWQPAADTAELARAGISHVVSCIGIRAPAPATTTILDMNDRSDQPIDPDSTTGLNAVRRHCFEAGRRVLVHCGSGVSRAPLVIVYSLARMFNLPADVATSLVRMGRPCICLNNGFRQQLISTFGPHHRDASADRMSSTSAASARRGTPAKKGTTPPRAADGSGSSTHR